MVAESNVVSDAASKLYQLRSQETREVLTDADGKATFGPVEAGDFFARIVELPSLTGRFFGNDDHLSSADFQARRDALKRPIKGIYESAAISLSPTASTATIQAVETFNVSIQFSGAANPDNGPRVSISGAGSGFNYYPELAFSTSTGATYLSKSLGESKFLIEVPVQLREAKLNVSRERVMYGDLNNELFYRCFIDGKEIVPSKVRFGFDTPQFALGTLDSDTEVQIIGYKSPKIIVHVVDEEGKPITEYYAGVQYAKDYPIAHVTWNDEGVRVEYGRVIDGRSTTSQISWAQIADRTSPSRISSIDIDFAWNSSEDATRVNATGIAPNEDLRLFVAAKGYAVASLITIPKLAEGEEREVTVTRKRR